jgi:hypothetical protein
MTEPTTGAPEHPSQPHRHRQQQSAAAARSAAASSGSSSRTAPLSLGLGQLPRAAVCASSSLSSAPLSAGCAAQPVSQAAVAGEQLLSKCVSCVGAREFEFELARVLLLTHIGGERAGTTPGPRPPAEETRHASRAQDHPRRAQREQICCPTLGESADPQAAPSRTEQLLASAATRTDSALP